MLSDEARFRRFARAVTTEVGALEESFLGLGRSLGAARVLNAIGRGIAEVADLRRYLKLDSGLMSRLLRGLEDEGLVVVSQDIADKRRRVASLTKAGLRAFRAYERLSDTRARRLVSSHRRSESLLAAMDLVATALTIEQVDIQAVDHDDARAKFCLDQYYAELRTRFDSGFDVTKSRDPRPAAMQPPWGEFLLAVSDGLPIGCGALCGDGTPVAEVKRVWVAPHARGFGVAGKLMSAIEEIARERGIHELRLDTNKALPEAISFYRAAGWCQVDRFNHDPYADYFFSKSMNVPPSHPKQVND